MKFSLHKFRREEEGVALVEFALLLPVMLLAFFTIVEFTRVFFSYQGAIVGVRDAARYMARTAAEDICVGKGGGYSETYAAQTSASGYNFYAIVLKNMDTEVPGLLPANVALDSVQAGYRCEENTTLPYRQDLVPMAVMNATFTITLPLIGILELNGQPVINPITHTVADETRIYGF